jgi:hypothetical protein
VVSAGALCSAMPAAAEPARASYIVLSGDDGDHAALGRPRVLTGGTFAPAVGDANGDGRVDGVSIYYPHVDGQLWNWTISTGLTGRPLEPGVYGDASTRDQAEPYTFNFYGESRGCSQSGSVTILHIEVDTTGPEPVLTSLLARSESHCDSGSPASFQVIAYNAPEVPVALAADYAAEGGTLKVSGERLDLAAGVEVDGRAVRAKLKNGQLRVRGLSLENGHHSVRLLASNGTTPPALAFSTPTAAGTSNKGSSLTVDSSQGDGFLNGRDLHVTDGEWTATAKDFTRDGTLDHVVVSYHNPTTHEDWSVAVGTSGMGTNLAPGPHQDVDPSGQTGPFFNFFGTAVNSCPGSVVHGFTIDALDVDYSLGFPVLERLALTFERYCEGSEVRLTGSLSYRAPLRPAIKTLAFEPSAAQLRIGGVGFGRGVQVFVDGQAARVDSATPKGATVGGLALEPGTHWVSVKTVAGLGSAPVQFATE